MTDFTVIKARDLLKTSGILRCTPEESLSQILPQFRRSHDAMFVFDEKNHFLGIVNPFYVLFTKSFPAETKVKNCLYHCPRLSPHTPFWEIAQSMIESRVYYLPVFEGERFEGIVSVGRLFHTLAQHKEWVNKLGVKLPLGIITVSHDADVNEAYSLLKKKNLSRLAVVDGNNHLVGMVTQYYMHGAFSQPREGLPSYSRQGNKKKRLSEPLRKYFKNNVRTVSSKTSEKELIHMMLEGNDSSIIMVDGNHEPTGIITTHDLLKAITRLAPGGEPRITVTFSQEIPEKEIVTESLQSLLFKLHRHTPLRDVHAVIEVGHSASGHVHSYSIALQAHFVKEGAKQVKASHHEWKDLVHDAVRKLENQIKEK